MRWAGYSPRASFEVGALTGFGALETPAPAPGRAPRMAEQEGDRTSTTLTLTTGGITLLGVL
jgi:hypothetical protein